MNGSASPGCDSVIGRPHSSSAATSSARPTNNGQQQQGKRTCEEAKQCRRSSDRDKRRIEEHLASIGGQVGSGRNRGVKVGDRIVGNSERADVFRRPVCSQRNCEQETSDSESNVIDKQGPFDIVAKTSFWPFSTYRKYCTTVESWNPVNSSCETVQKKHGKALRTPKQPSKRTTYRENARCVVLQVVARQVELRLHDERA